MSLCVTADVGSFLFSKEPVSANPALVFDYDPVEHGTSDPRVFVTSSLKKGLSCALFTALRATSPELPFVYDAARTDELQSKRSDKTATRGGMFTTKKRKKTKQSTLLLSTSEMNTQTNNTQKRWAS